MIFVWYVLDFVLRILLFAMIGRFIIIAIRDANPSWRPKGLVLVVSEIALTLTDPIMKVLNRFVRPVRLGRLQLDLSWTLAVLLISFAQALVRWQFP